MFLRNTWYVATRSDEIGTALTPMTILGEKIVLYRARTAPLSRSRMHVHTASSRCPWPP